MFIRLRQQPARLFQVRNVDHLAIELERACIGVLLEQGDDPACPLKVFVRGREGAVGRPDLRGMNAHHAPKAERAGRLRGAVHPLFIAEIGVDRLNRGNACRACPREAQRARQCEGFQQIALRVAVGRRAEGRCEVFRTPGQRVEPGHTGIVAQPEQRGRGFGRDHDQADTLRLKPGGGLQRGEIVAQQACFVRRRLGQHDPVRAMLHDRDQIGQRVGRVHRIDPHPQRLGPLALLRQRPCNMLARGRLGAVGDRILQVEDDQVGFARQRLFKLARRISGHEQEGTCGPRADGRGGRCGRLQCMRVHPHGSSAATPE